MTDPLRLEAEVVDQFSKPLKDLRAALGAIGAPRSAKEIQREFDKLGASVKKAREEIGDGLNAALSGLGAAGFSAAGAIAAITTACRSFAFGVGELQAFSRETGISIQTMRTLEAAAARFQLAPEQVRGGLKTFAGNMYDFRRQIGDTYAKVLSIDAGLAKSLRDADPDKQVEIMLDYLARVPNRATAGRIAELFTGQFEFARFGQEGPRKLKAILAETLERIGKLSPADLKKAEAFETAVNRVKSSVEGLSHTVATSLSPRMSELVGYVDRYIQANSKEIAGTVERSMIAIGAAAKEIDRIVSGSVGWDLLIKGVVAGQLAKSAAGFIALGSGFVGLGRAVGLANLAKLAGIFAILTGSYGLATSKASAAPIQGRPPSGADEAGGTHSGGGGGSTSAGGSGQANRAANKIEGAAREGAASGVEKGLDQAFGGKAGGGALSGSIGGARSGMNMLRNAMARGRGASFSASESSGLVGQGPLKGGLREKAMRVMARLIARGWTPEAAASAVGEFTVEGFDPTSGVTHRGGDKGASHGIGQWHPDRWARFLIFGADRAKRMGVAFNPADIDAQTDFFDVERKHRTAPEANWHKETDPVRAQRLGWLYERYGSATGAARLSWARRWLAEWKRSGGAPIPAPIPNGAALSAARAAGATPNQAGRPSLFVRLHGVPKSTRVSTDEGDAFAGIAVERSR